MNTWAIMNQGSKYVKNYINKRNVNIYQYHSVLMIASYYGNPELVKYFISLNANINAISIDEYTPLMYACKYRNYATVVILVENGALNMSNLSNLYTVFSFSTIEIINYLICYGLKLDHNIYLITDLSIFKFFIKNKAPIKNKNKNKISCEICNYVKKICIKRLKI